jgi:hypothetical protein
MNWNKNDITKRKLRRASIPGVDFHLLKEQRDLLLEMDRWYGMTPEQTRKIEGLINMIEYMLDADYEERMGRR